jgi:endonuclease YncB( thermonuclease family)
LLNNLPADAACVPDNTERVVGIVEEVYSGDSIKVDINGADFEVRYIGIDDGDQPPDVNSQLVLGKQVLLIMDVTDVDQYGRLPRYVIADGVFINLELVRRGAAFVSIEEPDLACEQAIKDEKLD